MVPAPPKDGTRGIFLHHDNAYTTATTIDSLNDREVQQLPHPPFSPDLSPCDFFLFPEAKKRLKGALFESVEDACQEFTGAVEHIPKSTRAEAKCMAAEGRIFERKKKMNSLPDESNQ